MAYCAHCGNQIVDDSSFCGSCGSKISGSVTSGNQVGRETPSNSKTENAFIQYFVGGLKKYGTFEGRASRKEYWMFTLFSFLISFCLGFFEGIYHGINEIETSYSVLGNIFALAIFLPSIALAIRRMHDVDKSGWYSLIPIYNLILLCTEGTPGDNRFGAVPKN